MKSLFQIDVLRQRLQRKARTTSFGVGGLAVESVCAAQLLLSWPSNFNH
jgi:hypothetical protein